MTQQRQQPKLNLILTAGLAIALVAAVVFACLFIRTNGQLRQKNDDYEEMVSLQVATDAELSSTVKTLTSTEATLTETQTALTDMTAKQEAAAAALAATEAKLTEAQTALTDMTAKQEADASKLATTEAKLTEAQTALADMTAKQETTATTLAATEAKLTEAQTALADMTAKQEADATKLATTEAKLTEAQTALADMTAKQEATAAALATAEAALTETQTALDDMTAKQEATAAALATAEAALTETQTALADMTAKQEETAAALAAAQEENEKLQAAQLAIPASTDIDPTGTAPASSSALVKEMEWELDGFHELALIVRNTSGASKKVSALVTFYDKDGKSDGSFALEQSVCGDAEDAFLSCSTKKPYASYKYSIELSDPVQKSDNATIDVTTTVNQGNVLVMAENTGTTTPDYIEYHCLFLDKDGHVVGTDWGNLDVPEPGMTTVRELHCAEDFAAVECYYSARSN